VYQNCKTATLWRFPALHSTFRYQKAGILTTKLQTKNCTSNIIFPVNEVLKSGLPLERLSKRGYEAMLAYSGELRHPDASGNRCTGELHHSCVKGSPWDDYISGQSIRLLFE